MFSPNNTLCIAGRGPATERWIQVEFLDHVVITGLAIQGGTNERVNLNNIQRPENAFTEFVIQYQYDLDTDNGIWQSYLNQSGAKTVSSLIFIMHLFSL